VLELRFLERLTVAETATAMGISNGNARVLQYRALRRAALLGEPGDG
jgi:RNA polymerase sigma-70 factor (ECF subfamily)